jgi:deoxyribose-phosphate aldolase
MSSTPQRNPGQALDLDRVNAIHVNKSAVERRAATLGKRRSVKKEWQAAWLVKAITLMDLTTLSGDDTPGRVARLCAKARQPLRGDMLDALGLTGKTITVGAVCVYPNRVVDAVKSLKGTSIPVAAVSTGFPSGQVPFKPQLEAVKTLVEQGAKEIDIVISRDHVHTANWQALYDEVKAFRQACGEAHLKTIIETGELGTLTNVHRASMTAMMAGSDFIKTSTGKASVNATLPFGLVMTRAIREYCEATGHMVGFKPAGGIRSSKDALNWLILIKEELGDGWLNSGMFRFGASGLLTDIERQLWHHLTGRYAADHHMPMA